MKTPESILNAVAAETGIPAGTIKSACRTERVSCARFLAAWVMRQGLDMTYAEITQALSRIAHGTAMNAICRAKHLRATNRQFLEASNKLVAAFNA